jgi:hypothetical protein
MLKFGQKNPVRNRRLFLENLESREVLAGNVAVTLSNGTLRVVGDNQANVISIVQQPNGRFNVIAEDGETITGPTTNLLVRNIRAEMRGGDDVLTIGGEGVGGVPLPAQVLGSTRVYGGNGSDILNVNVVGRLAGQYPIPAQEVVVEGDDLMTQYGDFNQDDTVTLTNTAAVTVTVNTQAGDDIVTLTNVLSLTTNVNTGVLFTLNGQTDDDFVAISNFVAGIANINVGTGSNVAGANTVSIETALMGMLTVSGWEGRDTVQINEALAALSLTVYTYGGNDIVDISDVQTGLTQDDYQYLIETIIDEFDVDISWLPFDMADIIAFIPALPGSLSVYTGNGNDTVTVDNVLSTSWVWIFLEGGNDNLIATDVEANYAFFNGGAGTNGRFVANVDADLLQVLLFQKTLPNPALPT